MNCVVLIGRLTRDPDLRYTTVTQTAVCTFTLAINRPVQSGSEPQADFPRIKVFGKTAENCKRYLVKGSQVGIDGRLQTGSYEDKEGQRVFTTDIIADRVEFLGKASQNTGSSNNNGSSQNMGSNKPTYPPVTDIPSGFTEIDDDEDIPF